MSLLRRRHLCQITDILYDLVTRVLGGKSVKCVLSDDDCIFTSDIETLLSNLDTEHPEIEIILQSLKSHKAQHGEGVKSFLFMVTRIAKAVKQLELLGIADCISACVMQEAIDKLAKEVHTFGLSVVASIHDSFMQTGLTESSFVTATKSDGAIQNLKQKIDESLGQLLDVSEQSGLDSSNQQHAFEVGTLCENVNSQNEPDHCEETSRLQSIVPCKKTDGESFDKVMESDFVYLKMSKCSSPDHEQEGSDLDSVEWFFDKQSNLSVENESHILSAVERSMNMISKNLGDHVMSMVDGKKYNASSEFYSDFVEIDKRNSEQASHVNCKQDSHDSDFEDCFDELDIDNQKRVMTVVVESGNENGNSLKSNEFEPSSQVVSKMEGLNIKRLQTNDDMEGLSRVYQTSICSRSSSQIKDDEFDDCFGPEAGDDERKDLQMKDPPLELSKSAISPGSSLDTFTKDNPDPTLKNSSCKKDDTLSSLSEITKLNSLLKQIGNRKTHDTQQVMFSTRHDLNEENSDNSANQNCSDFRKSKFPLAQKDSNHKKSIESGGNIEKDSVSDANIPSSDIDSTEIVTGEIRSGVSKLEEINTALKSLGSLKSPVSLAGIAASSRHIEHESEYQSGTSLSVDQLCLKSLEPKLEADVLTIQDKESRLKYDDKCLARNPREKLIHGNTNTALGDNSECELTELNASNHTVHIPKDIGVLCRGSDELTQLVAQVYSFQSQDGITEKRQIKRLDMSRVHCMSVLSPHCVRKMVRGLVIPCCGHTLEMFGATPVKRKTLLVNGDLKPGFVHKGHKPVAAKRVIVTEGQASPDSLSAGHKHSWATRTVDVLRKLSVDVLLVKGRVCDTLSDMLYEENIAYLSNVSYRALQIISNIRKVTPITYIQDAAESDACELTYQPLDEGWTDRDGDSHCLSISDLPQIQTVVLQLPSTQSCHVEEERVWNCLHRLSNALEDRVVLPGHGMTERWCRTRVLDMAQHWSGGFCPQTVLILQTLADVFQDYASFVRLNVISATGDDDDDDDQKNQYRHQSLLRDRHKPGNSMEQRQYSKLSSAANFYHDCRTHPSDGKSDDDGGENSITWDAVPTRDAQFKEDDDDNSNSVGGRVEINDIVGSSSGGYNKHGCNGGEVDRGTQQVDSNSGPVIRHQCDSFRSKVSSWSSALDLVRVLLSLDSLVVTGASSSDVGIGGVLL